MNENKMSDSAVFILEGNVFLKKASLKMYFMLWEKK